MDGFESHVGALEILSLALSVAILAEAAGDALTRRAGRDWRETGVNLAIGLPGTVFQQVVTVAVTVAALAAVATLSPWDHGTSWWTWPAALVLVDLAYYWGHRLEHRVRFLWAHHSVHHSSTDFDLSTSARIAWQDGLVTWAYFAPVALLGFHPAQIVLCYEIVLLYQVWVHTQRVGRVPWLEGILNTPAAHRVHHASNPSYLDKNYGGIFMIWDRWFGTWADERAEEPVRFGLTRPIASFNPITVNFAETVAVIRDALRGTAEERLWSVIGPPEWSREDGFSKVSPTSGWRVVAERGQAAGRADTSSG